MTRAQHWTADDDRELAIHRAVESLITHSATIEAHTILLDVAAGRATEAMRKLGALLPENLEEIVFDEIAFHEIIGAAWPSPRPWKTNARRFTR